MLEDPQRPLYHSNQLALHGRHHPSRCTQERHGHTPWQHFGETAAHEGGTQYSAGDDESTVIGEHEENSAIMHPPSYSHHLFLLPEHQKWIASSQQVWRRSSESLR